MCVYKRTQLGNTSPMASRRPSGSEPPNRSARVAANRFDPLNCVCIYI